MFGQRVGIATCLNIKEVVVAVAVRLLAGDMARKGRHPADITSHLKLGFDKKISKKIKLKRSHVELIA